MKIDYNPQQFGNEANSKLGQEIWDALTMETSIARMMTASDLDQPALKAVEDMLLDRFGDQVLNDRIKQMIGHMVRQIMEAQGYEHVASDVRISSVPFYKASRYARSGREVVYVFRSSKDRSEALISKERKLDLDAPACPDGGKWVFVNAVTAPIKAAIGYQFDLKQVVKLVARDGYIRHRIPRLLRPAG